MNGKGKHVTVKDIFDIFKIFSAYFSKETYRFNSDSLAIHRYFYSLLNTSDNESVFKQ